MIYLFNNLKLVG